MSIFDLRNAVIDEYHSYISSFLLIQDERIKDYISEELIEKGALWPPALLQLNPAYRKAETIEQLVVEGKLHPDCASIFRDKEDNSITLFQHQQEAIETALSGKGFVVTSGTGSGKSLTYFVPIMDAVLKGGPDAHKVWAIIVYPMNALVNSQYTALQEWEEAYKERTGQPFPIRFNKYTGQEMATRMDIQKDPPHILLTNYVMLELMMVRPEEHMFVDSATTALKYLVIDELHTYRGRQGADVAFLIRRLKERSKKQGLICMGTSATMIAGKSTSPEERRQAVASFAGQIFGSTFEAGQVIEETLESITPRGGEIDPRELREAIKWPLPETPGELLANPLVRWTEDNFGLEEEDGGRLRRRSPISLDEGAETLSEQTGLDVEACKEALSRAFLAGAAIKSEKGETLLSFKLHQFIAQGNRVFASLEPRPERVFDLEGYTFASREGGVIPLFPLKFCRICGVEYYEVLHDPEERAFSPLSDEFNRLEDIEGKGYLLLAPEDRDVDWGPENLPSEWLTEKGRVKSAYKEYVPRPVCVHPDGSYSESPTEGATKAWFQPQPFRLCLGCGVFYDRESEFRKLTGLSSEGRSTATTVLALSALENAPAGDIEASARKLLSFTDNRQDASLQAGHFNDFVQVSLLRAAIYAALQEVGELRYDEIAGKVVESLGLDFKDISANKELLPDSPLGKEVIRAFTDLTEYRIYEDLRRGWRVVQPNLEQCGLLAMDYRGLGELCANEEAWRELKPFADSSPEKRLEVLKAFLDQFRRQLAIHASRLQETNEALLKKRVEERVDARWGFEEKERLRLASRFILPGQEERLAGSFSLSARSLLHRYLKRALPAFEVEYEENMEKLVDILCAHGLLRRDSEKGISFVQLESASLVWKKGDGTPVSEPIYQRRSEDPIYLKAEKEANQYFKEFYVRSSALLREVEAREHTAQIGYEHREEREQRFRSGELKCLFCSPTMELGIDIADLQLVHMRNVPPTPANYAQRSGRAGRKGDPALVVTYCLAGSGHDQYFFHHQREMVSGAVQPPRIDLTSEDLATAHLHSVWLAKTGLSLGKPSTDGSPLRSIANILDLRQEGYPLTEDIQNKINLSQNDFKECMGEVQRILDSCAPDIEKAAWYTEEWIEKALKRAPEEFDDAFNRFRELYQVADRQYVEASDLLRFRSGSKDDVAKAERSRAEAERQITLLRNETSSFQESDFYPYRYLASEGFLPGYNFPRLPLSAFLPREKKGDYVDRPRFLAISEFAPESFIYHEGSKYQVSGLRTTITDLDKRRLRVKLCNVCGYLHADESVELCHNCESKLAGEDYTYASMLEATNVYTRRRERITSEEEERRRLGYQITTHFEFAPVWGASEGRIPASVNGAGGSAILKLIYAPSATIYRINHRWRASKEDGYLLDFDTGEFVPRNREGSEGKPAGNIDQVRLFVRDTMNVMLLYPGQEDMDWPEEMLTTLEHALRRGIEQTYQIEASELASERIGSGSRRGILFYEASEGGYGILRSMVEERDAFARVAAEALAVCHYDPETLEDQNEECVRACYDCLLSYSNQRDYPQLSRALVKDLLGELTHSETHHEVGGRDYETHYQWLRALTDSRSELERKFLDHIYKTRRKLPDDAQRALEDHHGTIPDFFYEKYDCVYCDGSVHDEPAQKAKDEKIRRELEDLGYRVIVIRYDRDLEEQVAAYPDVFGEAKA